MRIKTIKLNNFQLFKEATINLDKLNIITGINQDDVELSSNGAGKSTILNAILFTLYGNISGLNLADLITIGDKKLSTELEIEDQNNTFVIKREIPSNLTIFLNGNEIQANTLTLKQKFIDEQFCDNEFFKMFRVIDTNKGINILDQGIISLRKTMMSFIDDLFSKIRKNLLDKKLERERYNMNKRVYTFYLSDKKLKILEEGLEKLKEEAIEAVKDCENQDEVIHNLKADLQFRNKIIYFKEQENAKIEKGYCPILKKKCLQLSEQSKKVNIKKEIYLIQAEIKEIQNLLVNEEDCMNHYNDLYEYVQKRINKTKEYIMKLQEAFKFKEYKYTPKDVALYTEAIKILDSFAGYYINEWLSNLALIINDLLKNVNLEVTFSANKQFMTIKNGENELKFEQLSSGQKIFLNAIFKIAILLQKGETKGIILCDEGLSSLDKINLNKFIEICKQLNYQMFIIYQNIDKIEDVNIINIERKNNKSIIK